MPDVVRADRSAVVVGGGLVLGFGFGGLADGIVLHQVLQWHHLITDVESSQTLDGLERNVFWDGVFHAVTAGFTALGLLVLWHGRDATGRLANPMRTLIGLVLIGWGAFHVVDQLVFHLLLDLHDIREAVEDAGLYNWSFFSVGVGLGAIGCGVLRTAGGRGTPRPGQV